MPTTRSRRRRTPVESDVIAALRTGARVAYSPENWHRLVSAKYFDDPPLTAEELDAACELLEGWREEHERRRRFPHLDPTKVKHDDKLD